MENHTAGPWEAAEDGGVFGVEGSVAIANVYSADDFPCIDGDHFDRLSAECEANARLIAAAPELLQAVAGFLADVDAGVLEQETIDFARAALRKAARR